MNGIPEGGKPTDLPANPETQAQGPPEPTPPVDTGSAPDFHDLTGLPMIAMENTPETFPAEAENGEADDILDFLF